MIILNFLQFFIKIILDFFIIFIILKLLNYYKNAFYLVKKLSNKSELKNILIF